MCSSVTVTMDLGMKAKPQCLIELTFSKTDRYNYIYSNIITAITYVKIQTKND